LGEQKLTACLALVSSDDGKKSGGKRPHSKEAAGFSETYGLEFTLPAIRKRLKLPQPEEPAVLPGK
jgi:hypothetical protein